MSASLYCIPARYGYPDYAPFSQTTRTPRYMLFPSTSPNTLPSPNSSHTFRPWIPPPPSPLIPEPPPTTHSNTQPIDTNSQSKKPNPPKKSNKDSDNQPTSPPLQIRRHHKNQTPKHR